jgi:hypothetical protein
MFRIRRFGVIRTANVVAFLYVVIIAVIFVPIGLLFAVALPSAGVGGSGSAFLGNAGGVAIVFFGLLIAIFYGFVGWIVTAIACLLYNFAAGMIGGIEIQLEAVQPPPPSAVWGGGTTYTPPATPPPGAPPATPPPGA